MSRIFDSDEFNAPNRDWFTAENLGQRIYIPGSTGFSGPPPSNAQWFKCGFERTPAILVPVETYWQIDFLLSASEPGQTEVILGPLLQGLPFSQFPEIYIYINHASGGPLNCQSFPSGTSLSIDACVWYTAKFRLYYDKDFYIETLLSGGGYNNEQIEPAGPLVASLEDSESVFQANIKKLSAGSKIFFDNFFVTNDANFTPPAPAPVDLQSCAYITKEFYGPVSQ